MGRPSADWSVPEAWEARARAALAESSEVKRQAADCLPADIARVAAAVAGSLGAGGKVLLFGNGGSAADAQHIAGELVGRFLLDRPALPAVALTTDTSVLTCVANDYAFEEVFARQVEALAKPGDVVIAISTSGNARNVIRGAEAARTAGATVIGMTGATGGALADLCDLCIRAPSEVTARIQEVHITAGHVICELVERALCEQAGTGP
jgi:D-sedoheptulose 7-phosphate isomerase